MNKRGPTVAWVRIWNSQRRPNNAIIRLNVEDNEIFGKWNHVALGGYLSTVGEWQ